MSLGIDTDRITRILRQRGERLVAPDAADQLVPGQAKGFDAHS